MEAATYDIILCQRILWIIKILVGSRADWTSTWMKNPLGIAQSQEPFLIQEIMTMSFLPAWQDFMLPLRARKDFVYQNKWIFGLSQSGQSYMPVLDIAILKSGGFVYIT